jgi:porphobilinogen synthase
LDVRDLVAPLFVRHGPGQTPIESMPGQDQLSVSALADKVRILEELGVPAVILFGIPAHKDALGSEAYDPAGAVQTAVRALKDANLSTAVIADVCLCEYTDHGHCCVLDGRSIDTGRTLATLGRVAASLADAGADVVAPSGMMDGMVAAIREALDDGGHESVPILSYSAKYASAFYGPFREAAGSAPAFGDRHSYQMDPANAREAMREMALDIAQGADALMVKPALGYLDVVRQARDAFDLPLGAYNVSGEYAMLKAAAERGWLDERACALETLTAIKRAGADFILTYWAEDAARWLLAREV